MCSNKSKTILISGCSSGIGYFCAKALKEAGYEVIATARKTQDVLRLKAEGFESYRLDLNDSDSINDVLKNFNSARPLYALFNNAAYGQPGAVEDLSRDVIRQQFETNVFGTMELTNQVIGIMRLQGYGRIIHNSSVLGIVSLAYRGAYNASKYALEGFADTQRLELKGSGISISLIEPGPIISHFRQNAYAKFTQHIAIKKSYHQQQYGKMIAHFSKKEGAAVPFTLGPEAVYKKLLHALEAKTAKPRYYVTFPTYLFATLKRILPVTYLDWILSKV